MFLHISEHILKLDSILFSTDVQTYGLQSADFMDLYSFGILGNLVVDIQIHPFLSLAFNPFWFAETNP